MKDKRDADLQIVVVDDSYYTRRSIVETLVDNGLNVVGDVPSAERGIELTRTTSANVFIIDVIMPEIGGIDLAKFIVENELDISIIFISELQAEHMVIEALLNGAVDYIQKPFTPQMILSSMEKLRYSLVGAN